MRYVHIAILIVILALAFVVIEGLLRLTGAPISLTDSRGAGQMGLLGLTIGALVWFSWIMCRISPWQFLGHYVAHWRRALAGFATMFLTVMLLATVLFAIFLALGWAKWSWAHWDRLSLWILVVTLANLVAALVLATCEELIFRAILLRYLRSSLELPNTVIAILVSSAIFAATHLIAFQGSSQSILPLMIGLFLLGVLLATTYVVTGSLACAIGLHFGLLGFKVILRETDIGTFGGDVRTGPEFFVMMIVLTLAVIALRKQLWARFAAEPAALLDEDMRAGRISSF